LKKKNDFQGRIVAILSVVIILCFALVCTYTFNNAKIFWIGLVFVLLQTALILAYYLLSDKADAEREKEASLLSSLTSDFLKQNKEPVVILGTEGEIVWFNTAFFDMAKQTEALYNKNINDVLNEKLNIRRLNDDTEQELFEKPLYAVLGGVHCKVDPYRAQAFDNTYFISVFHDITEIDTLKGELSFKNPVVSCIAVDTAENSGFGQGNYREVTAKISIILQDFASSLNAILREVDRDRYILIMEEGYLAGVTEKKFDVLDEVRAASNGISEIPVTVSIGVSCIDGSFFEKEAAARQALDLAMQRGGDQVVLKTRSATEFYGGKTKSVQKKTKIRSRIIASELVNLFERSSNVLIMGHKYADHDSIGSCVGISRLARLHCEKVNIVVNINDINLKHIFGKLRGIEDYKSIFIDSELAQDMIEPDTLLIIVDANNKMQFESLDLFENVQNTVIIDHHRKTGEFTTAPKITYIEPSASSASELVAEILEQSLNPGALLKEEAELLFAGIMLDTKQFTKNTGVRTFSAGVYLRSEGANPAEAQTLFKLELEEFKREIKFENNIAIYRNIIAISVYNGNAVASDRIGASKAADRLLGINGVLASFALCAIENNIHISARSSGTVNVQLILEKLHGGGHYDAAGAQIPSVSMEGALSMLKGAIDEYLDEE